ncbi:uncharacterized protein [Macrobrachium rosenbergii]|uniref:uncharacterized protein n=1 Tax=Macrobrachium rosenbergii TaxID=79674 RepID=UPI0034D3EDD5
MIHAGVKFLPFITIIFIGFPPPGAATKYSNCLGRCELEVVNTHELFVRAEDILSFQRFFDPEILGNVLHDVTSLRVECSQALLGETVKPFQSSWVPFIAKILELHVQECRVLSLAPAALRDFKSLTSLRIDNAEEGTPFMAAEGGLEGLRNLASFTLTRVRLRSLNHSLFHNHTSNKLMKVYLSHNSLDDIDQCTFCGMQRLSDLDLSFNQLRGSDMEFLHCVHALYLLNVSHNTISSVNADTFQYNEILHTVDLSHNKLSSFSSVVRLLNRTKTLKEVFLANNPWKCNVTSLIQLRYLGGVTGVQIADWDILQCLEKGKWVTAQQLVFPFTFGHIFRFWHAMLIVAIIILCFCSVLAVKCFAEPLHETLPVALWRLMRNSLRPSSRRMEFTESLPSKVQHSGNSHNAGKLQSAEEGRSNSANCEGNHAGKGDGKVAEEGLQVSEIIMGNIIAENNKKVDSAPSTLKLVKSSNDFSRNRMDKKVSPVNDVSYVSYKTSLDHDAIGMQDEKKGSVEGESGNGETKRFKDEGEEGGEDIADKSETQDGEDLPLTTSAGVATTPTETQTMAMAGVRGLRQSGTASWMTVAQPHLSTSMDNPETSSPSHNLPTAVEFEFLDGKSSRRNTAVNFALHSPPPSQVAQGPPLRNYSESESMQDYHPTYYQNGNLTPQASCQPVILEEKKFRNVWSTTRVYPASRVGDMPVCHSCLEALSLPDVNNTSYVWEDDQGHRESVQQHSPFGKTSSFRQRRGMSAGFEDADDNTSPIVRGRYSHYIKRPRRNMGDKSIYRSLERGTRRRTFDYRSRTSSQDKYYYELSMQNKEHVAVKEASDSGNVISRLSHTKKNSEVFLKQGEQMMPLSAVPRDGGVPAQGQTSARSSMVIPRGETGGPTSGDSGQVPVSENSTGAREKSNRHEKETFRRDQECQYEGDTRGGSAPKSTTPVEDDGDHCDIDIEAQASQIIDVVELHAQSNCKTS